MAKDTMDKMGVWAFIIGLILAVIIALVSGSSPQPWGVIVLALLGAIVGILNISGRETQMFLIATIGFLISFQAIGNVVRELALAGKFISNFFYLTSVFMAAAAVVVAIIALFHLAKD
jgi:hypothetical protein